MTTYKLNDFPKGSLLKLNLGDRLSFHYHSHSSVGYFGNYELEGESCNFVDDEFIYSNPEYVLEGLLGADSAEGIFHFEALQEGTTQISFQQSFRGEVQEEWVYTIEVLELDAKKIEIGA